MALVSLPALPIYYGYLTIVIGLVTGAIYLWHAKRAKYPLLDPKMLRHPLFRAGILGASRLLAVNQSSGGNDLLLNSIAAAVIGGTSLFGGRGSVWSALLGALVIGSISNGMDLLALASSVQPALEVPGVAGAEVLDGLAGQGLLQGLAELGHGPVRFTEDVTVRMPSDAEQRSLDLEASQPVFEIWHVAYTEADLPVEVCVHVMPGSRASPGRAAPVPTRTRSSGPAGPAR